MRAVLDAVGLGMRYGRQGWALRDLTLTVPEGRIVALVGPNGAGKSTFLQLAVGLLSPSEGDVRVFGRSPRGTAVDCLSRVGYVAQRPTLLRRFSVVDLLTMGKRLNPSWDEALAKGRLRQLEIKLDTPVSALSGGMRAQVALVLALAKRPGLLLLDEPVASLDPLARHEFMRLLMDAAAADGLTVILSSHIIGDLRAACDYLVLLTRGMPQLAGAMDEIVANHCRMVGPSELISSLSSVQSVISCEGGRRQASLLIRRNGGIFDPRWEAQPVDLEQIVLAYLSRRSDAQPRGASTGPTGVPR